MSWSLFLLGAKQQLPCSPQVTAGDQPRWGLAQLQKILGWVCSWDVECLGPGAWCLCASAVTGVLDPSLMEEDPKTLPRRRSNCSESPPWPHYTTCLHFGEVSAVPTSPSGRPGGFVSSDHDITSPQQQWKSSASAEGESSLLSLSPLWGMNHPLEESGFPFWLQKDPMSGFKFCVNKTG